MIGLGPPTPMRPMALSVKADKPQVQAVLQWIRFAVLVALGGAAATQLLGLGANRFGDAALIRRGTLPILYVGALWFGRNWLRSDRRSQIWRPGLGSLAVALIPLLSFSYVALAEPSSVYVRETVQGFALVYGSALFFWLGTTGWLMSAIAERRMLEWLVFGGACSVLMQAVLEPLVALAVPAAFTAVVLGMSARRHRAVMLASAGFMTLETFRQLFVHRLSQPASTAMIAQFVVSAGYVLLVYTPPALRRTVVALACVLAVVAAVKLQLFDLFLGFSQSQDVTISHRAFEAAAVRNKLSRNPLSMLLGAGPGGTVNLVGSPDAATLAASGRDLERVEAVHLLPSYIYLKYGLVGLVAFCVVLGRAFVLLLRHSMESNVQRRCLVLFVLCGIANAVSAGTFFFSNPLPALLLGYLWVTAKSSRLIKRADSYFRG